MNVQKIQYKTQSWPGFFKRTSVLRCYYHPESILYLKNQTNKIQCKIIWFNRFYKFKTIIFS